MSKTYGSGNLPETRTGFGGRTEYLSTNGSEPTWKTENGNYVEPYHDYMDSSNHKADDISDSSSSRSSRTKEFAKKEHKIYQRYKYTDNKYMKFKKSIPQVFEERYREGFLLPHDSISSENSHYFLPAMDYVVKSMYKDHQPIDLKDERPIQYTPEVFKKRNISAKDYLKTIHISKSVPPIYVDIKTYDNNSLFVLYAIKGMQDIQKGAQSNIFSATGFDLTYTYFMDTSTGKTYRIKNDEVPKDVILKIADDGKNLVSITEKGDEVYPWEECSLEEAYDLSI